MFNLSAEHRRWKITNKCPMCGRFTTPIFAGSDGEVVSVSASLLMRGVAEVATCRRCGQSWNVHKSATPPTPGDIDVQIIETERTEDEEPIGQELRRIDNSHTSTSTVRRLRVSKRWLQRFEVQIEKTQTSTDGVDLTLSVLAKYKSATEAAMRLNYAVGIEDEQTFDEEIEFTVPAQTLVELRLRWKRIWQEGNAIVTLPGADSVIIPFRAIVGVTFDQESVDL